MTHGPDHDKGTRKATKFKENSRGYAKSWVSDLTRFINFESFLFFAEYKSEGCWRGEQLKAWSEDEDDKGGGKEERRAEGRGRGGGEEVNFFLADFVFPMCDSLKGVHLFKTRRGVLSTSSSSSSSSSSNSSDEDKNAAAAAVDHFSSRAALSAEDLTLVAALPCGIRWLKDFSQRAAELMSLFQITLEGSRHTSLRHSGSSLLPDAALMCLAQAASAPLFVDPATIHGKRAIKCLQVSGIGLMQACFACSQQDLREIYVDDLLSGLTNLPTGKGNERTFRVDGRRTDGGSAIISAASIGDNGLDRSDGKTRRRKRSRKQQVGGDIEDEMGNKVGGALSASAAAVATSAALFSQQEDNSGNYTAVNIQMFTAMVLQLMHACVEEPTCNESIDCMPSHQNKKSSKKGTKKKRFKKGEMQRKRTAASAESAKLAHAKAAVETKKAKKADAAKKVKRKKAVSSSSEDDEDSSSEEEDDDEDDASSEEDSSASSASSASSSFSDDDSESENERLEEDLSSLKVAELKVRLASRSLSQKGRKAVLLERLQSAIDAEINTSQRHSKRTGGADEDNKDKEAQKAVAASAVHEMSSVRKFVSYFLTKFTQRCQEWGRNDEVAEEAGQEDQEDEEHEDLEEEEEGRDSDKAKNKARKKRTRIKARAKAKRKKAANKSAHGRDNPYPTLLKRFADDLLVVLCLPEWPAAEMMLRTLVGHLARRIRAANSKTLKAIRSAEQDGSDVYDSAGNDLAQSCEGGDATAKQQHLAVDLHDPFGIACIEITGAATAKLLVNDGFVQQTRITVPVTAKMGKRAKKEQQRQRQKEEQDNPAAIEVICFCPSCTDTGDKSGVSRLRLDELAEQVHAKDKRKQSKEITVIRCQICARRFHGQCQEGNLTQRIMAAQAARDRSAQDPKSTGASDSSPLSRLCDRIGVTLVGEQESDGVQYRCDDCRVVGKLRKQIRQQRVFHKRLNTLSLGGTGHDHAGLAALATCLDKRERDDDADDDDDDNDGDDEFDHLGMSQEKIILQQLLINDLTAR